ncbi:MAG: S8 family serine peptidase, partial [Nanobdellota archaeon]
MVRDFSPLHKHTFVFIGLAFLLLIGIIAGPVITGLVTQSSSDTVTLPFNESIDKHNSPYTTSINASSLSSLLISGVASGNGSVEITASNGTAVWTVLSYSPADKRSSNNPISITGMTVSDNETDIETTSAPEISNDSETTTPKDNQSVDSPNDTQSDSAPLITTSVDKNTSPDNYSNETTQVSNSSNTTADMINTTSDNSSNSSLSTDSDSNLTSNVSNTSSLSSLNSSENSSLTTNATTSSNTSSLQNASSPNTSSNLAELNSSSRNGSNISNVSTISNSTSNITVNDSLQTNISNNTAVPSTNVTSNISNITTNESNSSFQNTTSSVNSSEPSSTDFQKEFQFHCQETCDLPSVDSLNITIKVSGPLVFNLSQIHYSVLQDKESQPVIEQTKTIPDQTISTDEVLLDLQKYFVTTNTTVFDYSYFAGGSARIIDNRYLNITLNTTESIALFVYVVDGPTMIRSNEFTITSISSLNQSVNQSVLNNESINTTTPLLQNNTNTSELNTSVPKRFNITLGGQTVSLSKEQINKLPPELLDQLESGKENVRVMIKTSSNTVVQKNTSSSQESSSDNLITGNVVSQHPTGKKHPSLDSAVSNASLSSRARKKTIVTSSQTPLGDTAQASVSDSPNTKSSESDSAGRASPAFYSSVKEDVPVKQLAGEYQAVELTADDLIAFLNSTDVEQIVLDKQLSALTNESLSITNISTVKESYGLTGEGTSICVLDTGLSVSSDQLFSTADITGYNFVNDSTIFTDNHGHGTAISYPLFGGAPDANYFIAKVIDDSGVGYSSDIIAGVEWCQDQDVDIISLSIGEGSYEGYCDDQAVAKQLNNASNQGIFVVASSGNTGSLSAIKNPACAQGVLAVSGSTKNHSLWSQSNINNKTLLLAPAQNIESIDESGSSFFSSGTSFSSPFVASASSLLLEHNSSFTPTTLSSRLIHTGSLITAHNRSFAELDLYNAITDTITNNLSIFSLGSDSNSTGEFTPQACTSGR